MVEVKRTEQVRAQAEWVEEDDFNLPHNSVRVATLLRAAADIQADGGVDLRAVVIVESGDLTLDYVR